MGAFKSGGTGNRLKNKNSKMAADMAAAGVKRTMYRDPITNKMRPIGTYPGGKIKG